MKRQSLKCPNNDLLVIALVLLILFLLIELFLRIYDLYFHAPWVDIPSHIFAGLAICAGAYWVLSLTEYGAKKNLAMFITLLAALVWEVLETLQELVVLNPPYLRDIFYWDGFFDVIFTVSGGLLFFALALIIKKTTKIDVRL